MKHLANGRWRVGRTLAMAVLACGCSDAGGDSAPQEPRYQGHAPSQQPPPHVVGGFKAQLPAYTLAPGAEEFPCWIIPIELEGASVMVGGAKLTTGPGLHHGNITTRPISGEGVRPCDAEGGEDGSEALDILAGGSWLFASSTQVSGEEWQTFPEGHAYPIKQSHEIVAHMHYLNTTGEEMVVEPTYEWFTVDETTVDKVMAPFGFVYGGFEIPPQSELTVTGQCETPEPFNIVHLLPHMHSLGTSFKAGILGGEQDGDLFLDSSGYDPEAGVQLQYEPAVDLSVGNGISFSCTWRNTFDKTIEEGVGDNEMCMLFGYGYPHDKVYFGYAFAPDQCGVVKVPAYDE